MALAVVDNGDGTLTISGATVTDNGDGSLYVSGPAVVVVDNNDGTVTIRDSTPADSGIIATPQPGNVPPRIQLDISGLSGATVTVVRVEPDGSRVSVRGQAPGPLAGGSTVAFDYDAPFNRPVYYVATGSGTPVTSATVTLTVNQPWLIHSGVPSLSCPLDIESFGDRTRDTNQGVFRPLGRQTAVVISDGVRHSAEYELRVRTSSEAQEMAMDALLDDASPLLLQVAYPGIARTRYEWVSIGQVTTSNIVDWFGNNFVRWVLPCTVTDAPVGELQAQRTLGNLAADFATLGDIAGAYATLRDILTDNRGS
jgi:hypothetical protein